MSDTGSVSSHSSSISSRTKLQKKLRFGELEIIDLPIELGNHPPSCGAPITIGWDPLERRHVHVDVYEVYRDDRRRLDELKLDVSERACILLRAGYSIDEIADATSEAQDILKSREESSLQHKWEFFQLASERAGNKIKKFTGMSRSATAA